MSKDLPELLAIGQQFHRNWLNALADTIQPEDTDYLYQRTWDDFTWCQEHMRAVVTLLGTYNPFATQIHLRLLKDEAYLQALAATKENTRVELYEAGKGITKSQKGKKRRVLDKAYSLFQSESGPGKLLKTWASTFNRDAHDNTSWRAATWDADIRFSPVTQMVLQNALLIFWMHHRLLPCIQINKAKEAETWCEVDAAYVSQVDEEWGKPMRKHLASRLAFTPEETVYKS